MFLDGFGEYIRKYLSAFPEKNGIAHIKACRYTPQKNGLAERMNRPLLEMVRSARCSIPNV